jgi:ABC-type nitrate/sulfonate/bicarbonate transport system ATPase subunit
MWQNDTVADYRRAGSRLRRQRRTADPWKARRRLSGTAAAALEHLRHYPGELSLGLARRVALARAFAVEPDLLALDEPFVSLDAALAARLRAELIELVSRRPVTTLLVTHDLDEAVLLADRVILLSPSPARVLAELPIENARSPRSTEELVAVRDEIARRVKQA